MSERKPNLFLQNIDILPGGFRNFSGNPTRFDSKGGKRYFNIRLDEDLAQRFLDEGISSVRDTNSKHPDRDPNWVMNVEVRFEPVPCHIWLCSERGRRLLKESSVGELDWMDIETADVEIRLSHWENNGNSGYKPYCSNLFVTPVENELTRKYANMPILSDDGQTVEASDDEDFEPPF